MGTSHWTNAIENSKYFSYISYELLPQLMHKTKYSSIVKNYPVGLGCIVLTFKSKILQRVGILFSPFNCSFLLLSTKSKILLYLKSHISYFPVIKKSTISTWPSIMILICWTTSFCDLTKVLKEMVFDIFMSNLWSGLAIT